LYGRIKLLLDVLFFTMDSKKTILVVDDESSLRHALVEELEINGYNAIEAVNGEEGLKMAMEHHPDLILLDILMPVMDGMTMLARLHRDEWGMNAKIILLTNLQDNVRVEESMKNGVFDYLIKTDWALKDLIELIKTKI